MNDHPASNPTLLEPCPGCAALRAQLDAALRTIAQLQAALDELQAAFNELRQRNSSNSSIPPSANPPSAPKPPAKSSSGRKPGGQPGHPGHHRTLIPQEEVDELVVHRPQVCSHCQASLPQDASPDDAPPARHQVWELPVQPATVTEHQAFSCICPDCGHLNRGEIPVEVRSSVLGPNLAAIIALLSGCFRLSKRDTQEFVAQTLGVPVSLGTVMAVQAQVSEALASPYEEARQAVLSSAVRNVDETGWKLGGRLCWLWTAATATAVFFLIHAKRGYQGLQALLSQAAGVVISDRWGAYNRLPMEERQVCWAHLNRDFRKLAERPGLSQSIGELGLEVVNCLFADWQEFKSREIDREELKRRIDAIAKELHQALEQGCCCADQKTARFCANLLAIYPALWLFAVLDGVEPTNNHAERVLRKGVLWRKMSFGNQSEKGCRFTERILTVAGTLRLQKQSAADYLRRAITARRTGQPAPKLLGSS